MRARWAQVRRTGSPPSGAGCAIGFRNSSLAGGGVPQCAAVPRGLISRPPGAGSRAEQGERRARPHRSRDRRPARVPPRPGPPSRGPRSCSGCGCSSRSRSGSGSGSRSRSGSGSRSRRGSMLALLAALLAARGAALVPGDCPALEMAGDVHSSLPGAHVVLTCPGGEPGRNSTVQWAWSSTLQGSLYTHHTLVLPDVQPSDSGSYSCFRDNQLAGTVHLLVEAPPEEPQLSCYQKCPTSNVMCEWRPQHPPSVTTKAVLLVKKSVMTSMEYFREPCWYSATSGTFSCKLAVQEADSSFYIVSACVANSVGSKSSQAWGFRELEILQPDPPVHVEVSAVAGKPRRLRVSWGPAPSWNSTYYRLRFQLRYRAERARDFLPPVTLQESQHHYEIPDAWSGLRHVVQLRAQEEFGNGRWSEWSQEVMGTPWTEPRSSPAVTREPPSTQAPTVHVDSKDILSSISPNTSFPVHFSPVPLPTFLVAGGSLTFGMLLCIAIVLRFKKTWRLQALKDSKASVLPQYSLGQLAPERPKPTQVLAPLISLPVPPSGLGANSSSRCNCQESGDSQNPYDVSNRDYFFPR
ncbi:interleukin-6 receptor subunit alpha isoform X3 [Erinaceus europaeus]|uniref:Interleukin-6 receptor subunit alpha isoform X3 n=1 Tax=Erinaceus europaeus TaxID=9365 RepID=A0ABM3Y8X4_ERIEU|nr:interleukin-6 receptor subunit alpha isoform X3 [Erinaceus europaeus]